MGKSGSSCRRSGRRTLLGLKKKFKKKKEKVFRYISAGCSRNSTIITQSTLWGGSHKCNHRKRVR